MLVIQVAAGILLAVLIIVAFCLFLSYRAYWERRRSEEHYWMVRAEQQAREREREAEAQARAYESERKGAWVAYYEANPAAWETRVAREFAHIFGEEKYEFPRDGSWPPGDDRGRQDPPESWFRYR
jgi:hypothetical protein